MSDLSALAHRALEIAGEKNLSIVTAESCTAGKLAALLSEVPGAAERLHGSFVTYTKAKKPARSESRLVSCEKRARYVAMSRPRWRKGR